jgi:hypothetical protein
VRGLISGDILFEYEYANHAVCHGLFYHRRSFNRERGCRMGSVEYIKPIFNFASSGPISEFDVWYQFRKYRTAFGWTIGGLRLRDARH